MNLDKDLCNVPVCMPCPRHIRHLSNILADNLAVRPYNWAGMYMRVHPDYCDTVNWDHTVRVDKDHAVRYPLQ